MSTAKSMATSYLNGKRNGQPRFNNFASPSRFKSSTSNLAISITNNSQRSENGRLKSTSMTNLVGGELSRLATDGKTVGGTIQRPASRNALDSIHNGMNAKYAQVQSKVLLHNIRPQAAGGLKSKSQTLQPATAGSRAPGRTTPTKQTGAKVPSDRTQLLSKLKGAQEELERLEEEREGFRQELERERADKLEQVGQLKLELQEKLAEHEKQHEEYHQKLLEAYELADQNRRAADSLLSESRQRDEENRKRTEELEGQLAELKEFVAVKEEMTGKMYELKEQMREERERYEEQLKSLHQVFENEKLRMQRDLGNPAKEQSYFRRVKPSLQSSESINRLAGSVCAHCCSNSRSNLQSDIYGSKLSTRMQSTARSAWKASKHFANSVITGKAVSISACRKRGGKTLGRPEEARADGYEQQLTSVIKVGASAPSQQQLGQANGAQASGESVIRVDQNNKLTIVTKFNEPAGELAPKSATGSEHSRCESSSSGRGTSSDAGSSSSQNGDEPAGAESAPSRKKGRRVETAVQSPSQLANRQLDQNNNQAVEGAQEKRPKGAGYFTQSKIDCEDTFKKWRLFFRVRELAGGKSPAKIGAELPAEHLESSRLRCQQLNRAARMASREGCARPSEDGSLEAVGADVATKADASPVADLPADCQELKVGQGEERKAASVGGSLAITAS